MSPVPVKKMVYLRTWEIGEWQGAGGRGGGGEGGEIGQTP